MSMDYWGIIGYGICVDDIYKYINAEKVNQYVNKFIPSRLADDDIEDAFDDDTFYGDPYTNFAEFLCELDDDKIFSYDDDGQGRAFFLYEPRYPWCVTKKDPTSFEDIEHKMVKILKKVCDADEETLGICIDHICTTGCG